MDQGLEALEQIKEWANTDDPREAIAIFKEARHAGTS